MKRALVKRSIVLIVSIRYSYLFFFSISSRPRSWLEISNVIGYVSLLQPIQTYDKRNKTSFVARCANNRQFCDGPSGGALGAECKVKIFAAAPTPSVAFSRESKHLNSGRTQFRHGGKFSEKKGFEYDEGLSKNNY